MSKKEPKFLVIAHLGYWGKIICRSLEKLQFKYEGFDISVNNPESLDKFLERCDATIIAAPPSAHFELAKKSIEAKKATWVEKPLCLNVKDAEELVLLARNNKVILHTDDTFCYCPTFNFLKSNLPTNRFGKPLFVRMNWEANGKKQSSGVVFDLAPHIISQLFGLFGCPDYISCTTTKENGLDVAAQIVFSYRKIPYNDNDFKVYATISWIHPVKNREISITTDKGVLFSSYNNKFIFIDFKNNVQEIEIVDKMSALEVELIHFSECIKQNKQTLSPGSQAARIVDICEKLEKSSLKGGREIKYEIHNKTYGSLSCTY